MITTVQLDSKDVRAVLARFFGVKLDDVIPNRYSFSIANLSAAEIEKKFRENKVVQAGSENNG